MKIGFIVIVASYVLLACGGTQNDQDIAVEETIKERVITQKTISNFTYTDYALSSDAEGLVADWGKYKELAIQINYLKEADLSFFNGDLKQLQDFLISFKNTLPEELQTNPITSRVTVLETKLLKLNENLNLSNIAISIQLESIQEVLEAFSNLNWRINKKLEIDTFRKIQKE